MTDKPTPTDAATPEPLSKRPSEANTLVWVADPISSTGVRGVFVDDITCLWWWGAGLIFQKEVDAAALALRMRSAIASHGQAPATQQAGATGKCMGPRCMASSANGYAHSRECIDEAAETQGWTPTANDYAKCGPSAPQPVAREPLTPERVKEIVRGAGYDQCGIPDTERAAFINGLRHGEREHGIKRGQHGTE